MNGHICDILNMIHRICYIVYIDTSFVNIFIDPDQLYDPFKEDLFPRNFIIGLDAPSNYFGAAKVFIDGIPDDGDPIWLRYINDNENSLPIRHPIDQELDELPVSLQEAL